MMEDNIFLFSFEDYWKNYKVVFNFDGNLNKNLSKKEIERKIDNLTWEEFEKEAKSLTNNIQYLEMVKNKSKKEIENESLSNTTLVSEIKFSKDLPKLKSFTSTTIERKIPEKTLVYYLEKMKSKENKDFIMSMVEKSIKRKDEKLSVEFLIEYSSNMQDREIVVGYKGNEPLGHFSIQSDSAEYTTIILFVVAYVLSLTA